MSPMTLVFHLMSRSLAESYDLGWPIDGVDSVRQNRQWIFFIHFNNPNSDKHLCWGGRFYGRGRFSLITMNILSASIYSPSTLFQEDFAAILKQNPKRKHRKSRKYPTFFSFLLKFDSCSECCFSNVSHLLFAGDIVNLWIRGSEWVRAYAGCVWMANTAVWGSKDAPDTRGLGRFQYIVSWQWLAQH